MFTVDVMSRTPIYEQLIDEVEKYVSLGLLKAGDSLPSVRKLSVELSVNPNTIQRSYSELYSRGLIVSVPGCGNFISEAAADILKEKSRARVGELKELLSELKAAGVSEEDVLSMVEDIYDLEDFAG